MAGWEEAAGAAADGYGSPTPASRVVVWGQPEILLYALPPCEDGRCGIGYPDFIETASGEVYLTETDKKNSRVHALPSPMLEMMWQQRT